MRTSITIVAAMSLLAGCSSSSPTGTSSVGPAGTYLLTMVDAQAAPPATLFADDCNGGVGTACSITILADSIVLTNTTFHRYNKTRATDTGSCNPPCVDLHESSGLYTLSGTALQLQLSSPDSSGASQQNGVLNNGSLALNVQFSAFSSPIRTVTLQYQKR